MESPSSTVRRRAWINSRRQCLTLEEVDPEGPPCSLPSASIADDDVFSDGCFTGKIENWLLGFGSEACSVNAGQQSFESALKANFDDDLSLGADASELNSGGITAEAGLAWHLPSERGHRRLTCSTPRQELRPPSLNLGHSMASSCLSSSSTCKTTSSVSEVLQLCSEDAEETLYQLGFGCDEPQVTARIPPRFFTFPSLVQGINFRLFLDSQLRRIREEDPSLTLASRFRQVQVLTAMANAFYSLYSHVSRTPVQKLAAPEFTFSTSPVERLERFRSSVRSEPRSPVERLKDTVSKMCLYTGSPRGSDSTSPQPSPRKRSSLPDVVAVVLEQDKTGAAKKLDWVEHKRSNSGTEEQTQQTVADAADVFQNEFCHEEKQASKQTDNGDADGELSLTRTARTSLGSSLSGETVIEADPQFLSYQPEPDSHAAHRTANLKPVAKVTYDLICPQIVESVHQAPFCTHSPRTDTSPPICSVTDGSCPGTQKPHKQAAVSGPDEDSHTGHAARRLDASRSLPVLAPDGSYTECCITVTGWEGDDVSSCPLNAPDSSHAPAVPPAQARVRSHIEGKSRYLKPLTHQGYWPASTDLQQVNSFELEEVHSAGEEDFGQSETTRTTTNPLPKTHQCKGEVARGDSVQSDSSGYAEEEVGPSSSTHSR